MKRGEVQRGVSRLAPRSKKMTAVYAKRAPFVREMLAAQPWCEACMLVRPITDGPNIRSLVLAVRPAVDVHEMLTRSRSGDTAKAILDEENCLCVCRPCHEWIGNHPEISALLGLVRHSWD